MIRFSRRRRVLLAGAALALPALASAAAMSPHGARADLLGGGAGLDVYNVQGSAAGIDVTVKSGYSFVAQPEGMVPRAQAAVADTASAVASPADPGDSIDTLPGLAVPVATGCIIPPLAKGASQLPPPFGDVAVSVLNSVNPTLTYQYEHAYVQYPNPDPAQQGKPQTAVLGTDAKVSDPSGTVAGNATTGRAHAEPGAADAEAGAGAGVSSLPIGLNVGRISSTVQVRGTGGTALSDATTTLHDIDLTPPQLKLPPGVSPPLLHVGSLVVTAHSARRAGAPQATGSTSVEYAGVTFAGQSARIDHNGVTLLGHPAVALQQLADAFNQMVGMATGGSVPPAPPGLPLPPPPPGYSSPAPHLSTPVVSNQVSHGGDENTAGVVGLTLTFASPVPVPSVAGFPPSGCSPPKPPSGQPVSVQPTPATYIVTLGNVSSSAYGLALPQAASLNTGLGSLDLGSAAGLSPLPSTDAGAGGGVAGGGTVAGGAPTGAPQHGGLLHYLLDDALLSRPVVVSLASILELLLLLTLWASYRATLSPRISPEASAGAMDLV